MLEPRLPFADAFTEDAEPIAHDVANGLMWLTQQPPEVLAQLEPYIHEIFDHAADVAHKLKRMH